MNVSKNDHSRQKLLYTIVEFTDGIEMVPTIWLSDDKKSCIWPPTKDQIRINKTIANLEVSRNEDEWPVCEILKIFGTAQSYKTGKEKLKMAEQISDIDSASGTEYADCLRKSRHS
ncbi:uncharacterized protein LOC107264982 [Cephus cinctus]|uniref:Uncharacterized protein LOC107264982 n=1 Tax=Cephus cinctus TaxID=211228 RepID=A0AAJ7BM31_CEPCN|nr:uncharacterized protein LOC107264982 [Cephus cinctus]